MSTSAELVSLFRLNPVDGVAPYRWIDDKVYSWLSEAQREACIRSPLITDTTTESVCRISVVEGTATYSLSPFIVRVSSVFLVGADGSKIELQIYDRRELDRIDSGWRDNVKTPRGCIVEESSLILSSIPTDGATIHLEVQRLPLGAISEDLNPEIPTIHHDELVNWVLYKAHLVEDDDDDQPRGRWKKYLDRFEAYFGKKSNSDLKRKFSVNTPHRTKAWW